MRSLGLALLLGCASCSATLKFHECDADKDCVGDGGAPLYCTGDHMCVDAVPDDRLCRQLVPAPGEPVGPNPLVIAGLYVFTLPNGVNDDGARLGEELASFELVNDLGLSLVHYGCITGGDPKQAARALAYAVTTLHAAAIIGPTTSDEVVKGVAPIVKQYGAVVVSPSATSPIVTTLDDGGLIWRTCPSDVLQAKVLAGLVPPMTPPVKLDLLYVDDNAYGSALESAFLGDFHDPVKTIPFPSGDAAAGVAKMDMPDWAVLISGTDVTPLVAALQTAPGQENTRYLMTDGARQDFLFGNGTTKIGWPLLSRISGTASALPTDPDPSAGAYRAFAANFEAHFHQSATDEIYTANGYDAIYLIALAASAAGPNPTGAAIVRNMKRLSHKGGPTFPVGIDNFGQALALLKSSPMAQIDVYGASGSLGFDEVTGDLISAPIEVWKIVQDAAGNPMFATDKVVTP